MYFHSFQQPLLLIGSFSSFLFSIGFSRQKGQFLARDLSLDALKTPGDLPRQVPAAINMQAPAAADSSLCSGQVCSPVAPESRKADSSLEVSVNVRYSLAGDRCEHVCKTQSVPNTDRLLATRNRFPQSKYSPCIITVCLSMRRRN